MSFDEKRANAMLVASLQAAGAWAWKVPDMPRGPQTRFVPTKPFDVLMFGPSGRAYVFEAKILGEHRHPRSSDFVRGIHKHDQLDELRTAANHGACAFVAWVYAKPRKPKYLRILPVWPSTQIEHLQQQWATATPIAAVGPATECLWPITLGDL